MRLRSFFFAILTQLEATLRTPDFEEKNFPGLIQERILEIQSLQETWRPFLEEKTSNNQDFLSSFWSIFSTGTLLLNEQGACGTYTLYDLKKKPCFVIKPTDECVFCLNNPKRYASAFPESQYPKKNHIPLYRSAQIDTFCYEIAKICNIEHVTPKTVLALLSDIHFFYPYQQEKNSLLPQKLCSIQEYLQDTFSLRKILEDLFRFPISEQELETYFDQENFEDLIVFLWLISDTDAHVENFRAYLKPASRERHPVYGLKKIDNSLSFPELNSGFSNPLMYLPNAMHPVSSRTRSQIHNLPISQIQKAMRSFHVESAYGAFEERISTLRKILETKDVTYYECSLRLAFPK